MIQLLTTVYSNVAILLVSWLRRCGPLSCNDPVSAYRVAQQ